MPRCTDWGAAHRQKKSGPTGPLRVTGPTGPVRGYAAAFSIASRALYAALLSSLKRLASASECRSTSSSCTPAKLLAYEKSGPAKLPCAEVLRSVPINPISACKSLGETLSGITSLQSHPRFSIRVFMMLFFLGWLIPDPADPVGRLYHQSNVIDTFAPLNKSCTSIGLLSM